MTRPSPARFTLALLLLAAGPALAQRSVEVDRDAMLATLQTVSAQLVAAQQNARTLADPRSFRRGDRGAAQMQLQAALDQATQQVQALDQQVRAARGPAVAQCPPPPVCPDCSMVTRRDDRRDDRWRDRDRNRNRAPMAIDPGSLQQILTAVNAEGFSAGKLRVLNDATANQYFLVDQVIQVMSAFAFPQDKIASLRMVAPRILDRNNQYKIYAVLTFDSTKAEAKQILDNPGQ